MPELADQLDEALARLRCGDSECLQKLIDQADDEAPGDGRANGVVAHLIQFTAAHLSAPARQSAPPTIANFEIIGELGRGGMGVVYEAVQLHPRRTVALKLMRPGRESDAYHRMLFDREILALASLEHPNIASLHHASTTDDGRAYFVMELVRGVPINEFAEHLKLDLRARLDLCCQLCDGVHHAHLRGVIHRDLKPSNVLVVDAAESGSSASHLASVGRVKIMDFGLARLVDGQHTAASALSQTIDADRIKGTIAFMSPEQLSGDGAPIDARSDVYALGVVVFQLLTGLLPLDPAGRSLAEFIRAAQEGAAPRLSSIRPALRGDLEVIVQTSMAHDRARRYQSAAQLAEDIRRYLRREPIFARPATALYQLQLFARRNKGLVIGTCAVLMTILGGLITTSIALMHVNSAQRETTKAQQTANQINEFLNQMLASADPNVTRGRDLTVVALLDEAVAKLDEGSLAGQESAEATVRMTIADAYLSLGLYPPAQSQYEIAVAQHKRAKGGTSAEVADALIKLSYVMTRQERFDEAHAIVDEALGIRTTLFGENSLPVTKALAARAEIWIRMSQGDEARSLLCELLPKVIALTGGEENEHVADIKGRLGYCDGCSGTNAEGRKLLEETLELERRLFGHDHERTARTLINLGYKHQNERQYELAESMMNEALAIRKRVYGDDHPAIASALFNLGSVHNSQRHWDEVEAVMREALAIQERRLVPGHYEIGRSRQFLAAALKNLNRCDEAEPHFRQAIVELKDQPSFRQSRRGFYAQIEMCECLIAQQRFEEAEGLLLNAVRSLPELGGQAIDITRGARQLVKLYEVWGKESERAYWQDQILKR